MNSYEAKLQQQIEQYRNVENVHDLPDIFHYWAGRYLAPPLTELFGTADPAQIFVNVFAGCRPAGQAIFLSIGAGDCSVEIQVAQRLKSQGLDFVIECLELSEIMLARGRQAAVDADVADHLIFSPVDLNHWHALRCYNAVMAHHSLHHIVALESVFDQVAGALQTGGRFVISDIIGRNGHMRWPEVESLIERIWNQLPDTKKYNHQLRRLEPEFVNWDCSQEGFEGIRAQDILARLVERFDFLDFMAFGNLTDLFVERSFGHNYDPDCPEDRAFIDKLQAANELLIDLGAIKPTMVIATMTPKGQAERPPRCYRDWTPEFCVRPMPPPLNPELQTNAAAPPMDSTTAVSSELAQTDCQRENSRLQSALQQAAKRHRELEEQIAYLHRSSSWRLTAPLRWFKRTLTRTPTRKTL